MARTRTMYRIEFVEVIKETDKAVLVDLDGGGEVWFPLGQIEFIKEELWISQWIYEHKELEVEVQDEDEWDE